MSLQRGQTRLTLGLYAIGWDGPQDSRAQAQRQPTRWGVSYGPARVEAGRSRSATSKSSDSGRPSPSRSSPAAWPRRLGGG